jgi:subfamily B ATP-binding cassette protein MsbA
MRRLSRQGQEGIGALSGLFQESVIGNRVVKLFGRESYEQERFVQRNEQLTQTFIKSEKIRSISGPVNEVLASIAIAGVMLYGGLSVLTEQRTQGDFIAFLLAVFLMYDPFKKLSRVNPTVQQGLAGADRIFEVLDTKSEIVERATPVPIPPSNSIRFEGVGFSYPARTGGGNELQPRALRNIDLEIVEGQQVALVGFSGSGKSTMVDLIPRFIDPTEGRILIGGVDLRDCSLVELRDRIAVVSQHTFLFNDTIERNIGYGRLDASSAEIHAAARAAFIHEFILSLPQGYQTIVGEAGVTLSGGERQRLAIARAILKNAPVLILDEATASLDTRAEREVQSALEELASQRTAIVIAHRLSTIQRADLIVVMREGQIVERGTHATLLAAGGEYARLHQLQFGAVDESKAPPTQTI